jgi:hypothetical protein
VRRPQRAADWRVRKPQKDRFFTRQPLTLTVGRTKMFMYDKSLIRYYTVT